MTQYRVSKVLLVCAILALCCLLTRSHASIRVSLRVEPDNAIVGQTVHATATITNDAPMPTPITLTASVSYMAGNTPMTSCAECNLWIVHPVYVQAVRIEMSRLQYVTDSYSGRPPPYWMRGCFWLPINAELSETQSLELSFDAVVI